MYITINIYFFIYILKLQIKRMVTGLIKYLYSDLRVIVFKNGFTSYTNISIN